MLDTIVIIFLGWPAMIASLLTWLAGLVTKKHVIIVIAGIMILPFAFFYVGGYLGSHWLGLLFSLGHFASAFTVLRNRMWLAWLFLAPYTVWMGMLAYLVLTQSVP